MSLVQFKYELANTKNRSEDIVVGLDVIIPMPKLDNERVNPILRELESV